AGDHHRPANAYPARIDAAGIKQAADGRLVVLHAVVDLAVDGLVNGLVVNGDDAVFGQEGKRDEDFPAGVVHEIADGAGDGRFAVAGRTVDEHRLAADDGRAQSAEQLFLDDEMGEGGAERLRTATDARDRLAIGLLDIVFQGHRRGADIGAQG